jgi:hypothetical protein
MARFPAKAPKDLEGKIASLIPREARAAAIAREREASSDHDSYLVGLVRRIPAASPQELEQKIAALLAGKTPRRGYISRLRKLPFWLGRQ